jgi:hypothetical protein
MTPRTTNLQEHPLVVNVGAFVVATVLVTTFARALHAAALMRPTCLPLLLREQQMLKAISDRLDSTTALLPTSSSSDMVDIFNLALIPIIGLALEPLKYTRQRSW